MSKKNRRSYGCSSSPATKSPIRAEALQLTPLPLQATAPLLPSAVNQGKTMSQTTDTSIPKIIRSAYAPKVPVQLLCTTPGRTKQSFKDECDINTIVSRFLRTGQLDFASKLEPRYGDTTGIEYQSAMNTVAAAKSLFNAIPAALRDKFENEPAKFLAFVQDERNRDEATKLGLLKPVAVSEVASATPPLTPAAKAAETPAKP